MSDRTASPTHPRDDRAKGDSRLFSLADIARDTGIPMATLRRYREDHPTRIPTVDQGGEVRFPGEALDAFEKIHREAADRQDSSRRDTFRLLTLSRVKRDDLGGWTPSVPGVQDEAAPPVDTEASSSSRGPSDDDTGRPATGKDDTMSEKESSSEATLTLRDISERTDIAYPTIARYANQHSDKIPHTGSGRKRRFPEEAIDVFLHIRKTTRRGRPPASKSKKKAAKADKETVKKLEERIQSLEQSQAQLEARLTDLLRDLDRPDEVAADSAG